MRATIGTQAALDCLKTLAATGNAEPRTYRIGGPWGDRIEWFKAPGEVAGWKSPRPRKGDLIESAMRSGKTGIFKVTEVTPCMDPPDMFFASVEFVGYKEGN